MKVLVTGAQGFLGRTILEQYAASGARLLALARSTPDLALAPQAAWFVHELPSAALAPLLAAEQPDLLVHAAGAANVGRSVAEPLHDFEGSVRILAHLLEAVRTQSPSTRLVVLSSAAVYGNPQQLPIAESTQIQPISPYGYHKRMSEDLCGYYAQLYGLQVCSLRIFSAYGPGLRRQVIWDICRKAREDATVELMGTGEESRDFIYAADIARAVRVVGEQGDFHAGVYNVASGVSTTIAEVAARVTERIAPGKLVRFNGVQRSGDPRNWQADVTRLAALGFTPQVAFADGLTAYIDWFLGSAA